MTIDIEFIGAAGTVTGSRHLVHTDHGTILLDCGLFQGRRAESRMRNEHLGFAPKDVDVVVLSHAHIDHSGALPCLVKAGYRGAVFATPATRDLVAVMLEDAAMIQASDAAFLNKERERKHIESEPVEPLYSDADVTQLLGQMVSVPYRRTSRLIPGVDVTFLDAGHVLGSAVVVLDIEHGGEKRRVVFSGDLGRRGMPILRDPEVPTGAEVLLMESTYGDRLHDSREAMDEALAGIIQRTFSRGGKVIIPTFALERAQEVLVSLHRLQVNGTLPRIPVYLDSPLAVDITQIFQLHTDCFDAEAAAMIHRGESPFAFEGLRLVQSVEESKAVTASAAPSVILSASGMCEAGRVLHHLKATVEDPKHAVVIIGFQAEHTLGRRLTEHRPRVRIFGVERDLRADVHVLAGFSAHADQRDLLAFAEATREAGPLRHVFLVHGEAQAQRTLKQKLDAAGFPDVSIPAPGMRVRVA